MSAQSPMDDHADLLLAEYALGTLPHDERRAIERRLLDEPQLRARLAWWERNLVTLPDDVEPVTPPAHILKGVKSRLFASSSASRSWWHSLGLWQGLAAASVAGLIVAGTLLANPPSVAPPAENGPLLVAMVSGDASDVRLSALYDRASGSLRINRTSGTAAQGRDFELWVIAGDQPPRSLGILPDDPTTELVVGDDIAEALAAQAVLAISDEPDGGSPTGQPTGAVLATGVIAEI